MIIFRFIRRGIILVVILSIVKSCIPAEDYLFPELAKLVNIVLIIGAVLFFTSLADEIEKGKKKDNSLYGLNQRGYISQSVKREVWRRDQGKCVECGSKKNLEFDHIIPVSKGGSNTARNIQLLCEKCNRSKSDKI